MGHGISGSLMILATGCAMIISKIGLMATWFSGSVFVLPIILLLECAFSALYFKLAGIRLHLLDTILPSIICPSQIFVSNHDRIQCLKKKCGRCMLNTSALYCGTLIFVYLPVYSIIENAEYFEQYRSRQDPMVHGLTAGTLLSRAGFRSSSVVLEAFEVIFYFC